jgi:lipopolysaccharide export system permease protein
MKTLDRFMLKSYLGPFILTFFFSLFVLLMQFLWKYIDDLVGKGLEWHVIVQLLFFTSASLVPLALPLAILLSSIMTMGNTAEHYELAALKASGISLQRVMRPMIGAALVTAIAAFFFSNYLLPKANLKALSLLYDVRQQKPALDIKEGIFYSGIENYTIRVGKKDKDGVGLREIMIYDHTSHLGNDKVITAASGSMEVSSNKRYLTINLKDGYTYEEKLSGATNSRSHPLQRSKFDKLIIKFDLTQFKMNRTNEELFKDNHQMLNVTQLKDQMDTLKEEFDSRKVTFAKEIKKSFTANNVMQIESRKDVKFTSPDSMKADFLTNFNKDEQQKVIGTAIELARSGQMYLTNIVQEFEYRNTSIARYEIEWHRKFTLSFACVVLFFIGAPLGAIIKKGGLGLPLVVSVAIFILFHVLSITGEKFAKEGVWPAAKGMWMAPTLILPLGIFLTIKATTDSTLFDRDSYMKYLRKLRKKKPAHEVASDL